MRSFLDELELASNAYRTKEYIVTQRITFRSNKTEGTMVLSVDTFYKRTKEREVIYERLFGQRYDIDGKRVKTTMSSRSYVE